MKTRAAWILLASGIAVTGAAMSSWWTLQPAPALRTALPQPAAESPPAREAADFHGVSERHVGVFNALEPCS